jgi:hypothetical protein
MSFFMKNFKKGPLDFRIRIFDILNNGFKKAKLFLI